MVIEHLGPVAASALASYLVTKGYDFAINQLLKRRPLDPDELTAELKQELTRILTSEEPTARDLAILKEIDDKFQEELSDASDELMVNIYQLLDEHRMQTGVLTEIRQDQNKLLAWHRKIAFIPKIGEAAANITEKLDRIRQEMATKADIEDLKEVIISVTKPLQEQTESTQSPPPGVS